MAAINMNQEQFEQATWGEKPVLVDFWAPWCGYCRRIGPAYEKIGEEYADSLAVGKINIDEEPQLAGAEGIKVIPTLVLFRNGMLMYGKVSQENYVELTAASAIPNKEIKSPQILRY